jgi:predicted HTH transcriptional regulator
VSFANSSGGLILYALRENDKGEASEIVNIETPSVDAAFRTLLRIVETGVEPRIIPPEMRSIMIDEKKIRLIKISPGFNKPHRVKANGKFYGRMANGRYALDVGEIRNLFLLSSTLEEKFEKFRMQRLIKIKSGDFPFVYYSQNIVTAHTASLSSLSNNIPMPLRNIASSNTIRYFPLYSTGFKKIYNFDG